MVLKRSYSTIDEIPEAVQDSYTQAEDGTWVINVEGAAVVDPDMVERHKEFRSNNRELQAQVDALNGQLGDFRQRFDGIDDDMLNNLRTLAAQAQQDEESALLAKGQIDEVIKRRTSALLEDLNSEIASRDKAYSTLQTEHDALMAKHATTTAITSILELVDGQGFKAKPGTMVDLKDRISIDWTVNKDGNMVLKRKSPDLVGSDGGDMTPREYVQKQLIQRRPYLFESAQGGGAEGSAGGNAEQVISTADADAFGANLEDIAAGKIKARMANEPAE